MAFNIIKEKSTLNLLKALSNMYEKPERKQNYKSGDDDDFLNSIENIKNALFLNANSPAETWILDSGASFHSSPSKELL